MWKTPSYQQVFCFFEIFPSPVSQMHIALHNHKKAGSSSLHPSCFSELCSRRKAAEKLDSGKKLPSKFVGTFRSPKNIC